MQSFERRFRGIRLAGDQAVGEPEDPAMPPSNFGEYPGFGPVSGSTSIEEDEEEDDPELTNLIERLEQILSTAPPESRDAFHRVVADARRRAMDRRKRAQDRRGDGRGSRGRDQGTPDPLPRVPKLPAPGTLAGDEWQRNYTRRQQEAYYAEIVRAQKQREVDKLRVAQEAYAAAPNSPGRRSAYAYDSRPRGDFDTRFPEVARIGHSS